MMRGRRGGRALSVALGGIPSRRWLKLTPKIMSMMTTISGTIISMVFLWDMLMRFCPRELLLYLKRYTTRFSALLNPYVQISIHQYLGNHVTNHSHRAYAIVEAYLSAKSFNDAKRFKAEMSIAHGNRKKLMLSMDEYEKTFDYFNGVEIEWISGQSTRATSISSVPVPERYYRLKFHKRYKEMITGAYLEHVMETGREIQSKNRQRRLYSNSSSKSCGWSSIVYEHPGRFETLAMEEEKKGEIMEELLTFSKSKDYYARIGKAWKRGYLLYGPPGTGKSTLIAAMANLLDYDVYDLELTSVEDNNELRKLLTETTAKSILVIEDIDCSLHLTGQRKKAVQEKSEKGKKAIEDDSGGRLTLSGLLNSIDGLWSACAGERLMVFTTNYVEKLDPALTRRGRMDRHIELSYCKFQGFRVLAKNYLELDEHPLFGSVEELIKEVDITPADVAENLIPKSEKGGAEECLVNLIATLQETKRTMMKKMEEETKKKMEQESKKKMGQVEVSKSNEDVHAPAQQEKVVVILETL